MSHALSKDHVRLYYEEAGCGTPILFVHEFAGDYRSWEAQVRYFSRQHRCIVYSARGYTPSDVPVSPDVYTYEHFRDDAIAVLDHLKIDRAHIVGLSMGGYTTLQVGLRYPARALSLTLAGAGSGSERWYTAQFHKASQETAAQFEKIGSTGVARTYGHGPSRIPFQIKDPRGFAEFVRMLAEHDAKGSANTMRTFQGSRPSLYDFESGIQRITLPALIVVGDEDDRCIEPALFLKKNLAASGLSVFPKTGHAVNLEEPALFNRTLADFIARVEGDVWPPRDPRSIHMSGEGNP